MVTCRNNHISVEINKPNLDSGHSWSHQCLGGPLTSIVASIVAEAWDRPITIKQEEQCAGKYHIELEVIR